MTKSKLMSNSIKKGLFIAFEGGEGAGKSTLVHAVADALASATIPYVHLCEPGSTPLGAEIRKILLSKELKVAIDPKAELLLFLAARSQNIAENITPALQQGQVVLCDRFTASTIAYQGYGRGLGCENVEFLCKWVCQETCPDITFFLDVDPYIGLERTRSLSKEHALKGQSDRIESEKISFHNAVRQGFLAIAKESKKPFICIDANKTKEDVFFDVWSKIQEFINSEHR